MGEFAGKNKSDDLFLIQIRLFRLSQQKWNLSEQECSELFKKYKIYDYIQTCYEFFHVQGDEANIQDIQKYLLNNGAKL